MMLDWLTIPNDLIRNIVYNGPCQIILRFPNGYSGSVIKLDYTKWFEVAVLDDCGNIDYSTPITSDVITGLTEAAVIDIMYQIKDLPTITKGH